MSSSSDDFLKQVVGNIPLLCWLSVREGIEAYTPDPDHTDRTRANIRRDKIIARLKANFATVEGVAFQERNNLFVMQIARGRFFVKVKKMNGVNLRTQQQPTQLVLAYKAKITSTCSRVCSASTGIGSGQMKRRPSTLNSDIGLSQGATWNCKARASG